MPDVVRSDSQRSDTSLRPRVSFNRDVHVKRIVPRAASTALEANENNYSTVPKNYTKRPKKEYIIEKVSRHKHNSNSKPEEKFYTLPRTRKEYKEVITDSISKPPKKPQRTFAGETERTKSLTLNSSKPSKKTNKERTRSLYRSASDAAKPKESDRQHKKQLTPIAEVPPHHDYFPPDNKVIVIDIDKAEDVAESGKKGRFFGKKFLKRARKAPNEPETMMHSSQKPAEKPPLTKGRTVGLMVRRLNQDTASPPPKPNVMVSPNLANQHNNNQPFSYTRGLSPERYPEEALPVIYAQVVCNTNGSAKQTVHAAFSKRYSLSDSDEGLGNEDVPRTKTYTRFGDELKPCERGCGDGMESKRPEIFSEGFKSDSSRHSVRTRRDLLESRIAKKIESSSPSTLLRNTKTYNYTTDESKSFDSHDEKPARLFSKTLYKSTPEIYRNSSEQLTSSYTYHNSLQRDRYNRKHKAEKEIKQRYSHQLESEDEGFESSLLIASEKQKKEYDDSDVISAEDEVHHYLDEIDKKISKSYNEQFVPRERCIDDGSHFDPRIDKEVTMKRNAKKPPRPENKKSSLEKVKKLFSRDTKKKTKGKNEMVREESLLARYTEYKGSSDNLDGKETYPENKDYHYGTRKRMKTPSINSNQSQETLETKKSNSYTNWFKSLDRLSQKKNNKKIIKDEGVKNLRFFGDTDSEVGELSRSKPRKERVSQSSRDLHNISEERAPRPKQRPAALSRSSHELRSSLESDGSQQSQRSVVYLHAATVGDIPVSASKEELSDSSRTQTKTLSRSFSVLAPWRPRYIRENRYIDYYQPPEKPRTLQKKKKAPSRSKENLARKSNEAPKAATLYKKREHASRENSRYVRDNEKISAKAQSFESLRRERGNNNNNNKANDQRDLSRSVSMPKNPEKIAGWYRKKDKSEYKPRV